MYSCTLSFVLRGQLAKWAINAYLFSMHWIDYFEQCFLQLRTHVSRYVIN